MSIKPGWKTTEVWLTLASLILGALVASGAGGQDEAQEWGDQLAGFIPGAVALGVYIWSRAKAKGA